MNEDIQILKEIEKAVDFCKKHYTREEIFNVLKIDSNKHPETDIEKQICILKLPDIKSEQEADLLVFHLTEHHGLIREACASRVNEFFKNPETADFFQTKQTARALLKAVNDINPNICRTVIEILPLLKESEYFLDSLYYRLGVVFEELEKLKRSCNYTKKLFNLYWGLEALHAIMPECDERLEEVLKECIKIKDYTIREKTALLLTDLMPVSEVAEDIKDEMRRDVNYYVKRYSSLW